MVPCVMGRKPYRTRPVRERFLSYVYKTDGEDGCWLWLGGRKQTKGEYGVFWVSKEVGFVRAHRFAWEQEHGPIPDGLFVLHRCDNPPCVRPSHLFLGTAFDNMADAKAKGRMVPPPSRGTWTHCKRGHRLQGDNLTVVTQTGYRVCRSCKRVRDRAYHKKKKQDSLDKPVGKVVHSLQEVG